MHIESNVTLTAGVRRRHRRLKGLVTLGFLALTIAVAMAYTHPADGYEISIYDGTPRIVWAGLLVALLVSITSSLLTDDGRLRTLALVLGGTSVSVIAAMPVLRGYWFYASADSLTHFGWIKDLRTGVLNPIELFYPGVHTASILLTQLTGFRLARSTMLLVAVFTAIFLMFVSLSMRSLTTSGFGRAVGTISGFMLLPINTIVIKLALHPISQAVLFFSLIFYLFVKYFRDSGSTPLGLLTNSGILLGFSTAGVLLYHPQQAAVVLVLFGTITMAQLAERWLSTGDLTSRYRSMFSQTVFLGVMFVVWASLHNGLTGQISLITTTIVGFFQGSSGAVGQVVAQRSSSLTDVGSGVVEIFFKLFLVSTIYVGLTALVMASSLFARLEQEPLDADGVIGYVSYGFLILAPFAFLHFVGKLSKLYFRYHASMMVIVTIIGGFSLYYFLGYRLLEEESAVGVLDPFDPFDSNTWLGHSRMRTARRVIISIALAAMLCLSLITVFPSPFIFQPSMHVTEMQSEGYEFVVDHQDRSYELAGAGMPPWRYRHALTGTTGQDWGPDRVPPYEYDHNLTGYLEASSEDGGQYIVVSTFDRVRSIRVIDGLHFNRSDFRALETTPEINRVQANGEVTLYLRTDTSG